MREKKVKGYKAFNTNLTNAYGVPFEIGRRYNVSGPAVFGKSGNGFHFCERLEDTLRFFDAMDGEIVIAEVIGSGDIKEHNDEYYGYYDMYAATELEVVRILPRTEIVDMFTSVPGYRVVRFVQGYKLTDQEKMWLQFNYIEDDNVLKAIAYYQDGDKDAYSSERAYAYIKQFNQNCDSN